jgi:hypothetical protein
MRSRAARRPARPIVRKLIDMPAGGASALERATAGGDRLAAGTYLTGLLERHEHDWQGALQVLLQFGMPARRLLQALDSGLEPEFGLSGLQTAYAILVFELRAGNLALRSALEAQC